MYVHEDTRNSFTHFITKYLSSMVIQYLERQTSLFPTSKAVCNFGAKIMNLRANTEYSKFAVRARNLQGVSEWVDLCPPTKRQKWQASYYS